VSDLTLTPKQSLAKDAILRWFCDPRAPQTFYLAGLGGTGKSTAIEHVVEEIEGRVLFAAFTGRAASVMRRKGCPGATTIHRLAYRPAGDPPSPESVQKIRDELVRLRKIDEPGAQKTAEQLAEQLRRVEEEEGRKGPRFSLNLDSEIKYAKLVVIDECSFVDERIGRDLESFGTKLLVLGDPAQLPPVYGTGYFTSRDPDFFLDEILRQELDNPIRYLAELARKGQTLPFGKHGESEVLRMGNPIVQDRVLDADIVIVGRNRTRHASNHKIRRLRGREEPTPVVGDRVICLRNDHEAGLLNGTQWIVERCMPDLDHMTAKIEIASTDKDEKGRVDRVDCETWLHHFFAREDELDNKKRRDNAEFDHGDTITCHRSQGGEWPKVVVFDEGAAFGSNAAKWRYTAASRASKQLTWVQ
jgi:exodeoxyribonuclease V